MKDTLYKKLQEVDWGLHTLNSCQSFSNGNKLTSRVQRENVQSKVDTVYSGNCWQQRKMVSHAERKVPIVSEYGRHPSFGLVPVRLQSNESANEVPYFCLCLTNEHWCSTCLLSRVLNSGPIKEVWANSFKHWQSTSCSTGSRKCLTINALCASSRMVGRWD